VEKTLRIRSSCLKTQGVMTLWGDFARSFNENVLENVDAPVIAVFAGFHVSEYLGMKNLLNTTLSSVPSIRYYCYPCQQEF